ncbi:(R)-citramalyl-CoA lyase (plasmid) [Antarctobacter heliothermus]|uniref:(R)-citramalyl-CoA lyase n=1 Tax=Antarctobacter heliothermus TaxID=74033 RepID=A0A222EBW1_9RHOB|nr:hydroxymethylglutaryl-CoA lyase [Antarctobacter heliothermus]ASP23677.1 (R)-citramalyl-CoA lyase [Antarctobacter heliothermus]
MSRVEIVEVGPRDGFQPVGPFIPTEVKLNYVARLAAAGLHRIEIGSFVSEKAVPQLADTPELLFLSRDIPGLRPQVLVPSLGRGIKAFEAGAPELAFVISASPSHSQANVRRTPLEASAEYLQLLDRMPKDVRIRLNIATAFDCPFDGRVSAGTVRTLLDPLVAARSDVEIALCDTTGRADPAQVTSLFGDLMARFPQNVVWAFHGHDTFGLGLANAYATWTQGVRVFDAAFAGLGGCPFAPGATGNIATEDLVNMFHSMGVDTEVDTVALQGIAEDGCRIPGALIGGRVRDAIAAHRQLDLTRGGEPNG